MQLSNASKCLLVIKVEILKCGKSGGGNSQSILLREGYIVISMLSESKRKLSSTKRSNAIILINCDSFCNNLYKIHYQ